MDESSYWDCVEKACLLPDLGLLADGDLTEIGERGINLSGGQKQRVNIARALYFDADIVLFDDPLSAVDAHVGKALLADAIVGALRDRGKAVVLVTHALHFLSQCDAVYTLAGGRIAERGTYAELVAAAGAFAALDAEFGGAAAQAPEEEVEEEHVAVVGTQGDVDKAKAESRRRAGAGTGKLEGRLIVREKRTTGSVGWKGARASAFFVAVLTRKQSTGSTSRRHGARLRPPFSCSRSSSCKARSR
jgi:ATP-binding cassette subfamily C (CFTR/MRP) protein 1